MWQNVYPHSLRTARQVRTVHVMYPIMELVHVSIELHVVSSKHNMMRSAHVTVDMCTHMWIISYCNFKCHPCVCVLMSVDVFNVFGQ